MAKSNKSKSYPKKEKPVYCGLPEVPERVFDSSVNSNRLSLILRSEKKWVNGTKLHYYFFDKSTDGEDVFFNDGSSRWVKWTTKNTEKDIVRAAFKKWKDVGIGLEFEEVPSRDEAEIRIGFMRGGGAWSYLGRDILNQGSDARTMNFGWDITRTGEIDTAIHEIGHTLGFPHEHQNPNAGIDWNEEEVYEEFSGFPNNWPRQKIYYNIIRKINPDLVQGSNWDPNSIMHYSFEAGLINRPEPYNNGLFPTPGLSDRDKTWVRTLYPPIKRDDYSDIEIFKSVDLSISTGEQLNFTFKPEATRYYNIGTFGISDTVVALFEDDSGDSRYMTADDDSGQDYNSYIRVKLFKNHKYIIRVRLYYKNRSGETALMIW